MNDVLQRLWEQSIQVGVIICIVLLVRQLFVWGRVPKRYCYLLWATPFLRMLIPWQIESDFSFLPSEGISVGTATPWQNAPVVLQMAGAQTGDTNAVLHTAAVADGGNMAALQLGVILAGAVWLTGVLLFVTYGVVSYWRLKRRLGCAIRIEENIYIADAAGTPFVMGIFKPRIYLPSDIFQHEKAYAIAHEQTHIRRKDYIIKLLAYLLVCMYWFHPLVWAAYICMGKDMEMSCDEAVMRQFGEGCKREYASVLLSLSASERQFVGFPLAFGEGNVKKRISNIMKYKKPLVFTAAAAIVLLIVSAVGLMTSPRSYCLLVEVEDGMIPEVSGFDHIEISMNGKTTVFPAAYNEIFVEYLQKQQVKKQPIDRNRGEDRAQEISIRFVKAQDGEILMSLNFDESGDTVWWLWEKPSFTYELHWNSGREEGAENVAAFVKRQLSSITLAEESEYQQLKQAVEEKQKEIEKLSQSMNSKMSELSELSNFSAAQETDDLQQIEAGGEISTEEGEETGKETETETEKSEDYEHLRSDLYGMEIVEGSVTPSGLKVHLFNKTGREAIYGQMFELKVLNGQEWEDVPTIIDNGAFTMEGIYLGEQGADLEVNWEWLYGKLSAGTYLLTKGISIYKDDGTHENIELGVMFALE